MENGKPNYQLKAIITRNKPQYRNTYYMGITEDYKKEATNTIEIDIHGKDKFDEIIKNKEDVDISNSIFSNPYIESINKYIDYDNALKLLDTYGETINGRYTVDADGVIQIDEAAMEDVKKA